MIGDYDDLRAILGLEERSESAYPALEYLMSSTESAIEQYCGRRFTYSATITETVQIGSATFQVPLLYLPIGVVSSVTVDGVSLDSSGYRTMIGWGLKLASPVSDVDVVVVYSGGYTTSTAPTDLRRAIVFQTAYEYQSIDHVGASSVRTEGGTVERPALRLLPEVMRALQPYRHPVRCRW